MKLMSARPSLAPAPISTENRAPAIRVDRSKSRIPRSGPRSQCALTWKSNVGGSPTRRTSWLSASLLPTGTLSWARLGNIKANASRSVSTLSSCSSCSLMRSPYR